MGGGGGGDGTVVVAGMTEEDVVVVVQGGDLAEEVDSVVAVVVVKEGVLAQIPLIDETTKFFVFSIFISFSRFPRRLFDERILWTSTASSSSRNLCEKGQRLETLLTT